MPTPHPQQTPPHPPSHPVKARKRSIDIHASIRAKGETWKVFEPCAVPIEGDEETVYRVEMEIVGCKSSNHFDVNVYVYWERFYGRTKPSKDALFGLARNLLCEFLTEHQRPPSISNKGYIELHWPPMNEVDEAFV